MTALADERTLQVGPEYMVYCRARPGSAGIDNNAFVSAMASRHIELDSRAMSVGPLAGGGYSAAFHVRVTEERTVMDARQMVQNAAYAVSAWVPKDWVQIRSLTGAEREEIDDAARNHLASEARETLDSLPSLPSIPNPLAGLPIGGMATIAVALGVLALVWFFAGFRPRG